MAARHLPSGASNSAARLTQYPQPQPPITDSGTIANQRGQAHEERAWHFTFQLSCCGLIPHLESEAPYITRNYGALDRAGVDLVVPTDVGDLYIQVKSSFGGKEDFYSKERSVGDILIPCIVVNEKTSDRRVLRQIARACWRQYYRLGEMKGRRYD